LYTVLIVVFVTTVVDIGIPSSSPAAVFLLVANVVVVENVVVVV
jgi:hypothetical protein